MAHKVLDQHCALASALESILLVLASKIVLQHNPAESGQPGIDANDQPRHRVHLVLIDCSRSWASLAAVTMEPSQLIMSVGDACDFAGRWLGITEDLSGPDLGDASYPSSVKLLNSRFGK